MRYIPSIAWQVSGMRCMNPKTPGGYCSDQNPNGWGNFGCQRCEMINDMIRKKRIAEDLPEGCEFRNPKEKVLGTAEAAE